MSDLIARMNDLREEMLRRHIKRDLREEMLRRHIKRDLQHECIEYLIASYQEMPSLRHRVSHPSYEDEMKAKCKKAYDKTLLYLNNKLGE